MVMAVTPVDDDHGSGSRETEPEKLHQAMCTRSEITSASRTLQTIIASRPKLSNRNGQTGLLYHRLRTGIVPICNE